VTGSEEPELLMSLMRRYAHAYVNSHDFDVCQQIMTEGYTLHTGPDVVKGRDLEYVPAVRRQFQQFPTLSFTVHDVVTDGTYAALLFTEHGTSHRHPGCQAAWIGVSLYRREGDRLAECWAEQDYFGRRQQLSSGRAFPLYRSSLDPWGTAAEPHSPGTEDAVRTWFDSLRYWPPTEGEWNPGSSPDRPRIEIHHHVVNVLFTAGHRAAFHITLRGSYTGGLPGVTTRGEVETYAAGLLTTRDCEITDLVGVDNRLAVQRQLQPASR
jgi:predicted ester cyclase